MQVNSSLLEKLYEAMCVKSNLLKFYDARKCKFTLCFNFRFQYVLSAPTSPATKMNEETLTYLNQGQAYDLKIKKIGNHNAQQGSKYYKV